MGYPIDLDEHLFSKLQEEIYRRKKIFGRGICTYCEREHNSKPSCRFTDRHSGKEC